MNALTLYKFFERTKTELQSIGDEYNAFIEAENIVEFVKIIGYNYFDEGGIDVKLLHDGTICIDLGPIFEHFDIDASNFNFE